MRSPLELGRAGCVGGREIWGLRSRRYAMPAAEALAGGFQVEVDDRGDVERQELREHEATDHGEAEAPARIGSLSLMIGDGPRSNDFPYAPAPDPPRAA